MHAHISTDRLWRTTPAGRQYGANKHPRFRCRFVFALTVLAFGLAVHTATATLVSHWALNENTGITAADSGPANNTGNLTNFGTGTIGWTTGKVGSAVALTGTFNSNAGFVTVGNPSSLNFESTNAFSISTWMKVAPGIIQDSTLAGKMHQLTAGEQNFTGYELHYYSGYASPAGYMSRIVIWLISDRVGAGYKYIEVVSTVPVNDGNWHQVAFAYDGSGLASGVRIFVDGVLDSSSTVASDTLGTNSIRNTVSFNLGSRQDGAQHNFTGSLDDVQVYNHSLTAADMLSVYQNPGSVILPPAPVAGGVDADFNPNVNGSSQIRVLNTTVQPDGKILLGGEFTSVGGQARNHIARIHADGTVESTNTFNPGTGADRAYVVGVALQPDGRIVLGGFFTAVDGQTRNGIARLNANGTLEDVSTFNPGTGADQRDVYGVALQTDGKILLAGAFISINGQTRNHIARLNADGTLEDVSTFNPGTGANGHTDFVALQQDGKILLGGQLTSVNGQARGGIARLHPDGTVETTNTFNPGSGSSPWFRAAAVQPDGKIVVVGSFTSVNGQPRSGIARLNADGTLESTNTFNSGTGANGLVQAVTLQTDGKILIGGFFTTVNDQPRNYLARLNPDGTLEGTNTFNPGTGPSYIVDNVAVQADGKILIGGYFTSVNGLSRNCVARLLNDAAIQSLVITNNAQVQWLRSGASPEVGQVTFEVSTNGGTSWGQLGNGSRIAGGWNLAGLNLGGAGMIRARGRTTGGNVNGASGLVETIAAFTFPATITLSNLSQNCDGTAKSATATTTPPGLTVNLTYNGSASQPTSAGSYTVVGTINDATYQGSATNTLVITDTNPPTLLLLGANPMTNTCGSPFTDPGATASDTCAGNLTGSITTNGSVNINIPGTYTVTYSVTDPSGNSVTNSRTVVVLGTATATPLSDQVVCAGGTAAFSTTPGGSGPFSFAWRKNGALIASATNNTIAITPVVLADAGTYAVEVSGACRSVTNSATLTVNTNVTATPLVPLTKCPGDSATFVTVAGGTGPFSHLWRKEGAVLTNATNSSLTIASVTFSNAGTYAVEVSGACGSVTNFSTLTVNTNTTASALTSLVRCAGDSATFTTVAGGTGPFSYVWRKDGAAIPNATNSSLAIAPVTFVDAGNYSVEVSGACSSTTNSATLVVNTNASATPLIDQVACVGGTATFSTTPGGTGPFAFVWRKDSQILTNATNSSFTISSVVAGDAGLYTVEVAGVCRSVTNSATLLVNTNVAASALVSRTNCPGTSASFSTVASGTGPFGYVWRKDGAAIPNATNSSLTIPAVTFADTGNYSVEISGACRSVTNSAVLSVNTNVTTSPLADLIRCPGDTASFITVAGGTGPFSYVWRKNGSVLPGATNSSFTIAAVISTDAGIYSIEVSGACTSTTNSATLTVNTNVSASALTSLTKCVGEAAAFTTVASGTGPFHYAWRKNGALIAAATNSSYAIAAVAFADAGTFTVEVAGACDSVTNGATLTVNTNVGATPLISLIRCPGDSASFAAAATGTGPFTYLWRKNGFLLTNATNNSFTVAAVTATDAGTYSVVVGGACSSVTNSATLIVNSNTTASAPGSLSQCTGDTAAFSTIANGTGPFTYLWRRNGAAITNATNSSFTIVSVTLADAGLYSVEVGGACNTATNSASLTVGSVIAATTLTNQTVCPGENAVFFTTVSGGGSFALAWRKNGILLPGETNSLLTLSNVQASQAGAYSVEVAGSCNRVTNSATLVVGGDLLSGPVSFTNSSPVVILDNQVAATYPSTITVKCLPGSISRVTVTLRNLSHPFPDDLDILLVPPSGPAVILMSDCGGGNVLNNVTITLDSLAATPLPNSSQIVSGTYRPANYVSGDVWPAPAPQGAYVTNLTALNGLSPNGTWSLYALDDTSQDSGLLDGWILTIEGDGLPASSLSDPRWLTNSAFQFTLHGTVGRIHVIEASADFYTWTPVATNVLFASSVLVTNLPSPNFQHRFYRAVRSP